MAIDFPNSPSNNDTYTVGSKTWVYSSAQNQWLISPTSPAPSSAQYVTLAVDSTLSSERVLTAGTGVTVTDSGANSNVTIATTAILPTFFDNKGELIAASGADTAVLVPNSTTNGQVLTVNTSATSGMNWADLPTSAPPGASYVTLSTDSTLSNERVLLGGTGITVTDNGAGANVSISTTAILPTIVDNKGDLIVGSGADTVVRLANATANNQVLVSNSATASGLEWDDPYTIPQTIDTAKTGAYTIQAADAGKFLRMNATADFTVANTTGFSSGQRVDIIRLGAGACGVVAGSGVTINSAIGLELRAQYSAASIVCIAANSYYVIGDLSV